MTKKQIIKLGTDLGLTYDEDSNYPHISRVVFNGVNGQRFTFDSNMKPRAIYEKMGQDLMSMGRRKLKMELHVLLNITTE